MCKSRVSCAYASFYAGVLSCGIRCTVPDFLYIYRLQMKKPPRWVAFVLLFRESKRLFSGYDEHHDGHRDADHPINDLDLIAQFVMSHLDFDL